MPLILTSRTPWRRRPSGLYEIDRSSPLASGLVLAVSAQPGGMRGLVGGGPASVDGTTPPLAAADYLGGVAADVDNTHVVAVSGHTQRFPLTISAWVRGPATLDYFAILGDTATKTSNHMYRLGLSNNGKLTVTFGGVAEYIFTGLSALTSGAWYFVSASITGNGGTATAYQGSATGWETTSRSVGTAIDPGGTLNAYLGTGNNYGPTIRVADVWQHNRVLSEPETRALYAPSTRWSLYQPLVRRVYFDLGGGATTLDSGLLSLLVTAPAVTVLTASAVSAGTQTATVTAPTTAAVPGAVTADAGSATATATAPAADATAGAATVGAGQTTATTTAPTADTAAGAITIAAGAQTATVTAPDPSVVLTGGGLLDAGIVAVTVTAPSAAAAAGAITVAAAEQTVTISAPMPAVVATITRDAGTITVTITAPTGVLAPGAVLLTAGMASVVVTAGGAVLVVAGGVVPEASGRYTWTIGVRDDTWRVPARDDTWEV